MQKDSQSRLQELVASGQVRLVPQTFPQRELWETSPVPPADTSNHIRSFIDMRGPLTLEMCIDALRLVVARQEAMRTSFLPGKECPVQMIRAKAEPVVQYLDLGGSVTDDEEVIAAMEAEYSRPFDLVRGPLYRLQMVRRGPDRHAIGLAIHHSIADGWTVTSFTEDLLTGWVIAWGKSGKDMSRLRGMRDSLPPLAATYSEWGASERARWQPSEIAKHAEYWRARLEGARPLFGNAGATLGPVEKRVTHIPSELAEPARAAARKTGVTLFSALLAAFRIAVFRWKGAGDFVVGTPVAGRAKTALNETMGYFSGIVPLRSRIDPGAAFADTMRTVHDAAMDDFAQAMPFVELAAAVEKNSPRQRHAVFDVRFAVQNHPFPGIEIPGMSSRFRNLSSGTTRFDIACELTEDGKKMELVWIYRPSAATRSDVDGLDRLFRAVLEEIRL